MKNQDTINKLKSNVEKIDLLFDISTGEIISTEKELLDIRNNNLIDWKSKKNKSRLVYSSYKRIKLKRKQHFSMSMEQIKRVRDCANLLDFELLENNEKRLKSTFFCKNKFCPLCAWRRSIKLRRDNDEILSQFLEEDEENRLLFLTLTMKNCKFNELKSSINMLNYAIRKMRQRKQYKKISLGEIKVLEITVNKQNKTFHPHLHLIIAVKKSYFNKKNSMYITHSAWSQMWKECMRNDYYTYTNIQAVDLENKNKAKTKAIAEISKYSAKDSDYIVYKRDEQDNIKINEDLTDEILYYLYEQTKNARFISYTKRLKEIKKELNIKDVDEYTDEDMIDTETDSEKSTNIVVRYMYNYGYADYLFKSFYINTSKEDN